MRGRHRKAWGIIVVTLLASLAVACGQSAAQEDETPSATTTGDGSVRVPPPKSVFHNEDLGIEFKYPSSWVQGTTPSPYVSCFGCTVVGPAETAHPYGIQLFTESLSKGCGVTCYVGNRALPEGEERSLTVAGHDASQVEIERQAPLGLAYQTGDYTPYREKWTLIPLEDRALFVVAFYRFGDTTAEVETESAYDDVLASLLFLPETTDTMPSPSAGADAASPSPIHSPASTPTIIPTPDAQAGAIMEGRITSIEGSVVTIGQATGSLGGPSELVVEPTSDTLIRRAIGSAPSISVIAGNDVPLRIGDPIEVGGPFQADGSIRAEEIEVSAFNTHDGVVTALGPNYFDIRLRKDKLSNEFFDDSTRVWVPTPAEAESLKQDCGTGVPLRYLKVGDDAAFQGLLADDSSMVALCLFD